MMSMTMRGSRFMVAAAITALLAAALAAAVLVQQAGADPATMRLKGTFDTPLVGGPACDSPVGLCFAGEFRGSLKGPSEGTVASLTPTAQPGVFLGDATATIHDRRGDVICAHEQFVFNGSPDSDGQYAFLCEITGGTGRYSGARGYLYGIGTAPPGTGQDSGTYHGEITR